MPLPLQNAFVGLSGGAQIRASISNVRLEVTIAAPVISNVAAGGITSSRATITWNTNEISDSQVEYGTTTAYGQSTPFNSEFGTTHSQGLTGLTAGTVYHYRVKSRDAYGNLGVSGDYTFTTAPLVIYNVAVGDIAASCLIITWNTNYNSDSQVEYGPTIAYGQSTTLDPTRVTAHSQLLNNLTAGTLYHYRVRSRDEAGNLTISGDYTHTTGSLVVTNVTARNITTTSATITWTTNEITNSLVEYGPTTAYGQETTLDPALVTEHSQVLNGLTPATLYHYRVESGDGTGNHGYCGDFTFTTAQSAPLDGLASLSYEPASNRINTPGFEYDPAGNQTRAVIDASGTQQQYRYDCAGRLAQVLDGNGNVLATYSYGAGNQRLMSVEGGATKYFAWAGGKIIAEYEAWGTNALIWKTSYVYLGGRLLATTSGADGSETRFHHPDRLGTRLVTNVSGTEVTVVSEQLSMPFGTMLPFTQNYGGENSYKNPTLSNPSKKRFTTYDRSDTTGLDYAVNRHYSSAQGRFTQVDPIEMSAVGLSNPQTLNLYAYCGNDPINNVDPDGLFWGAIGRFFKALGKALLSIFASGSGVSSGPDFRTPPTFPGSLPGINAAERSGLGDFRTPPFVGGFLQQRRSRLVPPPVGILVAKAVVAAAIALVAAIVGTVLIENAGWPPTNQGDTGEDRRTPNDIYVFKPFKVRPRDPNTDRGDIEVDQNGNVAAQTGTLPEGKSFFGDPNKAPLTGPYYRIPKGAVLPVGTSIMADGRDVNPNSPHAETHHTLFPTVKMPFDTFNTLVLDFIQRNAIPAGRK